MTKLYFNTFNEIGILINETDRTYKVIKGDLVRKIKSLFYYRVNMARMKEVYRNVKGTYSVA